MTKHQFPVPKSAICNLQSAILILALALLAGCGGAGGKGKKEERLVQSVEVATVKLDTVLRTVQLLGTLQGEQQAMALPKIAGRVTEIAKPEGSRVNEGDPIAFVVNDVPGMDFKPGPVRAPLSGVVGKVYVEVGQTVAPTIPVAAVSSFSDRVKVKASISDADLPFVKVGALADVSVSAIPDRTFAGRVSQVSPMLDPMSRSATVEVSLANPGGRLVPGMTVSVKLTLERKNGVPAIPTAALFTDGSGRVMVVEGKVASLRPISTGLIGDELVEVVAGLAPGEQVATTGKERIKDGETVSPVEAKPEAGTGDSTLNRASPPTNPAGGTK